MTREIGEGPIPDVERGESCVSVDRGGRRREKLLLLLLFERVGNQGNSQSIASENTFA